MDKRAEELSVEDFINFTIEWKTAINLLRRHLISSCN